MRKLMDIKLVKLVTGEVLVTQVEDCAYGTSDTGKEKYARIDSSKTRLTNPTLIVPDKESGKLVLVPWLPFAKPPHEFDIDNQQIVFVHNVHDNIVNAYNQEFGSGVVVPKKTLIKPE
jgi:hypothetical protein